MDEKGGVPAGLTLFIKTKVSTPVEDRSYLHYLCVFLPIYIRRYRAEFHSSTYPFQLARTIRIPHRCVRFMCTRLVESPKRSLALNSIEIHVVQDTVRQASLSHIRRHCDPTGGAPPRNWSRGKIADVIDNGVEDIIAGSWRALGLKGAARCDVFQIVCLTVLLFALRPSGDTPPFLSSSFTLDIGGVLRFESAMNKLFTFWLLWRSRMR